MRALEEGTNVDTLKEGTGVEALKAKLYAKYGDLRIQPARPSECERTSLHDAPSLPDSYVDLHRLPDA